MVFPSLLSANRTRMCFKFKLIFNKAPTPRAAHNNPITISVHPDIVNIGKVAGNDVRLIVLYNKKTERKWKVKKSAYVTQPGSVLP